MCVYLYVHNKYTTVHIMYTKTFIWMWLSRLIVAQLYYLLIILFLIEIMIPFSIDY